jgi:hypothetical protein
MARIARVVFPGIPHHITQRGNLWGILVLSSAGRRKWIAFFADKSPAQNPRPQTTLPFPVCEINKVSPEFTGGNNRFLGRHWGGRPSGCHRTSKMAKLCRRCS